MSTWTGWQDDFLNAAAIIVTKENRNFLTQWAGHANSPSCKRNPIDLHHQEPHSTDCVKPAGFSWWTQSYASHATAAEAFSVQVNTGEFAAILDTLGTGDPYTDPGYKDVVKALKAWGSTLFAEWFRHHIEGSSKGAGAIAPRTHRAWHDLQKSVNHNLPHALREAHKLNRAALRELRRASRVRH